MDLSIVIVNYNVKYFLEQCLYSVEKASRNMKIEVFVVDNNSVDGSCAMVREKFPKVHLIENNKNLGFSKANNQAIRLAKGRHILLLNPDTVIEEDTLDLCVRFMSDHPEAGALGVKMIDGNGKYLPESKRSLPTPRVAFCKIFGLSGLFPTSKIFSKYHLGYLDKNQVHEVDILPGAFMMIRKSALEKTGLLDEDFFMYGEDIDLSYRLLKAGYKNYYYPEITIIHYKGESTKKGSLNYVVTFYNAMIIFARKHFSKRMARSYVVLINLAVYFRAFLSIIKRFIYNVALPLFDTVIFYLGFILIKPVWESYKFPEGGEYPKEYMHYVVPAYVLIWIITLFFSGGYDKPVKLSSVIKGIISGTLIILVIYALLPESMRYSRALLLLGATWSLTTSLLIRFTLHLLKIRGFELELYRKKKIIIVGHQDEAKRVESVMEQTDIKPEIVGLVSPERKQSDDFIGSIHQIEEIVKVNRIDEIIFCAKDIPAQNIIGYMINLANVKVDYKIAPPETLTIIGSNSINTAENLYLIDFNIINKPSNRRNKRLFDVVSSLLLVPLMPFMTFFIKNPLNAFLNIIRVLAGKNTWVGFFPIKDEKAAQLPEMKRCILYPTDGLRKKDIPLELINKLNIRYSKDYKILYDASILLKGISQIGRNVE